MVCLCLKRTRFGQGEGNIRQFVDSDGIYAHKECANNKDLSYVLKLDDLWGKKWCLRMSWPRMSWPHEFNQQESGLSFVLGLNKLEGGDLIRILKKNLSKIRNRNNNLYFYEDDIVANNLHHVVNKDAIIFWSIGTKQSSFRVSHFGKFQEAPIETI